MPIKVFKMNDNDYCNSNKINEWADKNNFKIDNINVCPIKWYINSAKSVTTEVELAITVIYHKKRTRRNRGESSDIK